MLIIFEVVVARAHDADAILSPEVLSETQAQIMTLEQARAVGFTSAELPSEGCEVRLIAVTPRDARFVQSRLESSEAVSSFCAHEIGV